MKPERPGSSGTPEFRNKRLPSRDSMSCSSEGRDRYAVLARWALCARRARAAASGAACRGRGSFSRRIAAPPARNIRDCVTRFRGSVALPEPSGEPRFRGSVTAGRADYRACRSPASPSHTHGHCEGAMRPRQSPSTPARARPSAPTRRQSPGLDVFPLPEGEGQGEGVSLPPHPGLTPYLTPYSLPTGPR